MRLNLLTKGERYSFSKRAFRDTVQRLKAKPGGGFREAAEISDAHFRGDTLGKTVNFTDLTSRARNSKQFDFEQPAAGGFCGA